MVITKFTCKALTSISYLSNKSSLFFIIFLITCLFSALPFSLEANTQSGKSAVREIISYEALVNKSIYTHSNETIDSVVNDTSIYDNTKRRLLQTYFEPFSSLCNERLKSDAQNFTNIVDLYPIYSAQPAWVALFIDGRFQLFYSQNTLRVFVPGNSPQASFDQHYSVIRHPINEVLEMDKLTISQLEIYAFNNDYLKYQIELNPAPYTLKTSNFVKNSKNNYCLPPRNSSLDLQGLESIFTYPMLPEAIEVTNDNKLYIYAQQHDVHQTIAKEPIAFSDFAVIYRSIFHYGYNPPFISLDKNEDNRYAKVNYGGYLENTRVGEVVLEADKLFKTITTGFDTNSKQFITEQIDQKVDSYLSEDMRSFLTKSSSHRMSMRYWFYPDSVLTVTNGDIGLVKQCQFFADLERTDKIINKNIAAKETIEHLNTNFTQYQSAFPTLRELDNVARLMALVNWLKFSKINERIELDELLSVELPAHPTPINHNKVLVLSTISYPKNDNLTPAYIKKNIKQFYLTDLLPDSLKVDSDQDFFDFSLAYHSNLKDGDKLPEKYASLYLQHFSLATVMESQKEKINEIKAKIKNDNTKYMHNQLIHEQNSLIHHYNNNVNRHSELVSQINNLHLSTTYIVSLSGGIDLNPDKFTVLYRKNDTDVEALKKMNFMTKGNVSKYKNWLRNNIENY